MKLVLHLENVLTVDRTVPMIKHCPAIYCTFMDTKFAVMQESVEGVQRDILELELLMVAQTSKQQQIAVHALALRNASQEHTAEIRALANNIDSTTQQILDVQDSIKSRQHAVQTAESSMADIQKQHCDVKVS